MIKFLLRLALLVPGLGLAAPLPWEREEPLCDAARHTTIDFPLDPQQPATGANVGRNTLANEQIRAALWGPPQRVTLSILKTDVWDRRYGRAPTLTIDEVRAGALAAANRGFDDMPAGQRRPVRGYLKPEGGREDRYACWNAYPFPCEKPVGQIILGLDELAGASNAEAIQSCASGVTQIDIKRGSAAAHIALLLPMKRNVFALRAHVEGIAAPTLRLYRHEDQAWRRYMNPDRKSFRERTPGAASGAMAVGEVRPTQIPFDYAKDAAWNGPVEPPESGTDGKYFWIHQRMPPEKTFPRGFDYVLMGLIAEREKSAIDTRQNERGLGTPPAGLRGEALSRLEDGYRVIRDAPGAAATATLRPNPNGDVTAFVTVVSCNDAADPFAEAKRQLDAAARDGFDQIATENAAWFARFYDRREDGRIFFGDQGVSATDNVAQIFSSWGIRHGGANKPDPRRFEATASYANVEQDWQLWHSLPCYNELFYTPNFVRHRGDSVDLWWKLVEHWLPAARANAHEVYHADGMALVHGYLPPVKANAYVHTNVALEYSIDTIAQMVKPLWDEWDYGADERFLREHTYPALRDAAQFYATYAQRGADDLYHFSPAIEAEAWGIFPEFARGKDTISALAMARWAFLRAAEAAEYLRVDANLRANWLAMEKKLAPYPEYEAKDGRIFNSVDGTIPSHQQGDHGWYIGLYPATLSDEINLDSPEALRAEMARTAIEVRTSHTAETLLLVGMNENSGTGLPTRGNRITGQETHAMGSAARSSGAIEPEALLNSRGGRIHLFPAVPAGETIGFRKFQARGGFLVSAVKDNSGVNYVEIESRRSLACRVMNPWPTANVVVRDANGRVVPSTVDHANGECLVFATLPGARFRLERTP